MAENRPENCCYVCTFCNIFSSTSMIGVLRHIGAVHAHEPNFHVVCGISDCPSTYKNYQSFRKHLRRHHSTSLEILNYQSQPEDNSFAFVPIHELDDTSSYNELSQPSPNQTRKHAAFFILKTKEVLNISETATTQILNNVTDLVQHTCSEIQSRLTRVLLNNNIQAAKIHGFDDVFKEVDPFGDLKTKFKQDKYFVENLGLVNAVERRLGSRLVRRINKLRKSRYVNTDEFYYDVPLLESLRQLMSNDYILDEILNGHSRTDGLVEDFCDALAFKEHELYSKSPTALQIMFYYDDVEVCNPIGSRTKIHKLGFFYYTLGNLSPRHRSSLNCIQLITVVKHSYIKKYGFRNILAPFIRDIKRMERDEGVDFEINDGEIINLRGSITVVVADNLASWAVGGYKCLASAKRKCRFCMASSDNMRLKFTSEEFVSRTKQTHQYHCTHLNGPLHNHISKTFGIVSDSFLNDTKFFHVTDGLAPDIMHDVLEGTLEYETKEILQYLIIEKRMFTLQYLNDRINGFAYGYSDSKNKPSQISLKTLTSRDHNLKQTASQMWTLGRLLPLMIGELVPLDDPYWENFTLLLTITDYVFAPVLSSETADHLKILINDHHHTFKKLYPNSSIIPKMHYNIHLPEWIKRFGPPSRYWCMRFEAKHAYFKNLTHVVRNFKNIAKTLSGRHQSRMCYQLAASTFDKQSLFGNISATSKVIDHQFSNLITETIETVSNSIDVFSVPWCEVRGVHYKQGAYVIIEADLMPKFGEIKEIIVINSEDCYFICRLLLTDCYNTHYHCYEVIPFLPPKYILCSPKNLYDYHVVHNYSLPSILDAGLIPLKYHILENI